MQIKILKATGLEPKVTIKHRRNYSLKLFYLGFADCSVNKVYQTAFLNYESDSHKPITLTRSFNYTTMDRPGIVNLLNNSPLKLN
jgi:hypothetical protein